LRATPKRARRHEKLADTTADRIVAIVHHFALD
jgi:hypothetical protein